MNFGVDNDASNIRPASAAFEPELRITGPQFCAKLGFAALKHDPEKWIRFSEKIMLKQKAKVKCQLNIKPFRFSIPRKLHAGA
jgi:hypothetical protein